MKNFLKEHAFLKVLPVVFTGPGISKSKVGSLYVKSYHQMNAFSSLDVRLCECEPYLKRETIWHYYVEATKESLIIIFQDLLTEK